MRQPAKVVVVQDGGVDGGRLEGEETVEAEDERRCEIYGERNTPCKLIVSVKAGWRDLWQVEHLHFLIMNLLIQSLYPLKKYESTCLV